jgi:hypothetical protein
VIPKDLLHCAARMAFAVQIGCFAESALIHNIELRSGISYLHPYLSLEICRNLCSGVEYFGLANGKQTFLLERRRRR